MLVVTTVYHSELQDSYLCGGDVLDGTLFLQVPDDHETSSVADDNLVWVDRVLM